MRYDFLATRANLGTGLFYWLGTRCGTAPWENPCNIGSVRVYMSTSGGDPDYCLFDRNMDSGAVENRLVRCFSARFDVELCRAVWCQPKRVWVAILLLPSCTATATIDCLGLESLFANGVCALATSSSAKKATICCATGLCRDQMTLGLTFHRTQSAWSWAVLNSFST